MSECLFSELLLELLEANQEGLIDFRKRPELLRQFSVRKVGLIATQLLLEKGGVLLVDVAASGHSISDGKSYPLGKRVAAVLVSVQWFELYLLPGNRSTG